VYHVIQLRKFVQSVSSRESCVSVCVDVSRQIAGDDRDTEHHFILAPSAHARTPQITTTSPCSSLRKQADVDTHAHTIQTHILSYETHTFGTHKTLTFNSMSNAKVCMFKHIDTFLNSWHERLSLVAMLLK